MNHPNPGENPWLHWVPRPPAPAIKTRLFGPTRLGQSGTLMRGLRWAPVFASGVLVLTVLNTGPRLPLAPVRPDNPLIQAGWSNQNLAPFADAQSHSGANAPPIIRWTNLSFSFLNKGLISRGETNR